jgi:hypothetical protein
MSIFRAPSFVSLALICLTAAAVAFLLLLLLVALEGNEAQLP